MITAQHKPMLAVHCRWMIRRDMPAVLAIEQECFEFPWDEDEFIAHLRVPSVIAMVAEAKEQIVGFMVYELHKHQLHVINFAVHPDCRYKGVGRQMVKKLADKLSPDRRTRLVIEVRESNLDGQLFCKAMGFRCNEVLRDHYDGCAEDAYRFAYRYREANECQGS